ncbi:MAG TPA: biopolymer transporter ExbD [Planctomycetaceae bacterium]|nr:biopolymer transporter ExbD [Planctomycetaceae bacterium]
MTMRGRRTRVLVEPPSHATGDIAFNLIVFFLVCASIQPDSGRPQTLPSAETVEENQQQDNIEVAMKRTAVLLNGEALPESQWSQLPKRLKSLLSGRSKPEDRIVVVKSDKDTPYHHWIHITSVIEDAGGVVTLQLEEEREVQVP